MAFAKLSAAAEDAVRAFRQGPQDKGRIDAAGTHHPDGGNRGVRSCNPTINPSSLFMISLTVIENKKGPASLKKQGLSFET
jgi:hypothetical protein